MPLRDYLVWVLGWSSLGTVALHILLGRTTEGFLETLELVLFWPPHAALALIGAVVLLVLNWRVLPGNPARVLVLVGVVAWMFGALVSLLTTT